MKFRNNIICEQLKNYINSNPNSYATIGELCNKIGVDTRKKYKVYNCILYWRQKFIEFYDELNKSGGLQGDQYQKWRIAISEFDITYGVPYFSYDKDEKKYSVPDFYEKQETSNQRIIHWIKSGQAVLNEMAILGETLVLTGKTPTELVGDLKLIENKILDGPTSTKCKNCEEYINPDLLLCPNCGEQTSKLEVN